MLGRSHVISGLAGASILLSATPTLTNHLPTATAGVAIIAGSAILPDIDHPGATVSRSLPPVTQMFSQIVASASGGHRKGTHSIFGWVVFGLLAYCLSLWHVVIPSFSVFGYPVAIGDTAIGLGLLAGFLAAISLTALHLDPLGVPSYVVAFVMLIVGSKGDIDPILVGLFVTYGTMIHSVFGDCLTTEKVPLLYPLSKKQIGLPVLGKTGSGLESLYVLVLTVLIVVAPSLVPWIQSNYVSWLQ